MPPTAVSAARTFGEFCEAVQDPLSRTEPSGSGPFILAAKRRSPLVWQVGQAPGGPYQPHLRETAGTSDMHAVTTPCAVSPAAVTSSHQNSQQPNLLTGRTNRHLTGRPRVSLSRLFARPNRGAQRRVELRTRIASAFDESTLPEQWKDACVAEQVGIPGGAGLRCYVP